MENICDDWLIQGWKGFEILIEDDEVCEWCDEDEVVGMKVEIEEGMNEGKDRRWGANFFPPDDSGWNCSLRKILCSLRGILCSLREILWWSILVASGEDEGLKVVAEPRDDGEEGVTNLDMVEGEELRRVVSPSSYENLLNERLLRVDLRANLVNLLDLIIQNF